MILYTGLFSPLLILSLLHLRRVSVTVTLRIKFVTYTSMISSIMCCWGASGVADLFDWNHRNLILNPVVDERYMNIGKKTFGLYYNLITHNDYLMHVILKEKFLIPIINQIIVTILVQPSLLNLVRIMSSLQISSQTLYTQRLKVDSMQAIVDI